MNGPNAINHDYLQESSSGIFRVETGRDGWENWNQSKLKWIMYTDD